jgi:predicted nucleic acid-binding protein
LKKIFLDTNILIDLLADRKPFSKYALAVFKRAEEKKLRLYTSSHSIATAYCLLSKHHEDKALRLLLQNLLNRIQVIPVDLEIIEKALRSKHPDVEDAIQIFCACSIEKMDGIMTRNVRDFKNAELPVFSPEKVGL